MLYVAYGSNMNLEQMAYRCPNSKVVCNGMINGWKLIFNVHADIIKSGRYDVVPVVVWDIADEDWNMLDMYEGYPYYYIKETVNVITDNEDIVKAIVYAMRDDKKGICPPFKNYFDTIERGYVENGIDVKYLYEALKYSNENETKYNRYKREEMV